MVILCHASRALFPLLYTVCLPSYKIVNVISFEHAFPHGAKRKANPDFQKAANQLSYNTNITAFYTQGYLNHSVIGNVVLILGEMKRRSPKPYIRLKALKLPGFLGGHLRADLLIVLLAPLLLLDEFFSRKD